MTDPLRANILARTYFHRVSAWRPAAEGERQLCTGEKCALSRSAHTSAPTPPDGGCVLPETDYRMSLYTLPDRIFRLGDRLEITDMAGRIFRGRASDSFRYPSHCVTVVNISEVWEEDGE